MWGSFNKLAHRFIVMTFHFSIPNADGIDYTLNPTNLTFPAGSARGDSQCLMISITDDEAVESREVFYVELSTYDSRIQVSEVCPRTRVFIGDNDCKFVM